MKNRLTLKNSFCSVLAMVAAASLLGAGAIMAQEDYVVEPGVGTGDVEYYLVDEIPAALTVVLVAGFSVGALFLVARIIRRGVRSAG